MVGTFKALKRENDTLRREIACANAAIAAICQTAGGLVEGCPTGSHNVLQRIRQLTAIEDAANQHNQTKVKPASIGLTYYQTGGV
jgi:hypothetical protein